MVLIFLLVSVANFLTPSFALAKSKLQFKFGDTINVFAKKSYTRNNGRSIELVGNAVIIHGEDSLYGEAASVDMDSGVFLIEGNVRFVSNDLTTYGSKITYNLKTGAVSIENARVATSNFYIVAKEIKRISKNSYYALDAEYSTCKDCPESWTIFGSEISLTFNEYVTIKHALFKINNVNVMYVPYLVLPAKKNRETGILFPKISSRVSEGISIEQPWFWAISDNKDLTLAPTFWARRGHGVDVEYRHLFSDKSWLNVNSRVLNDDIYLPGKTDLSKSGQSFFRHFTVFENHYNDGKRFNQHFRLLDSRDMDIQKDHPLYVEPYLRGSEMGGEGFFDVRTNLFTFGAAAALNNNILHNDPINFDDSYVQILPKTSLSLLPISILNSNNRFLEKIRFGFDMDWTVFRQNNMDESTYIRNAARLNAQPYIDFYFGNFKNINYKSKVFLDFQRYIFRDDNQENFRKYAARVETQASFVMEKIFGLAYEKKIKRPQIRELENKKADLSALQIIGGNQQKDQEMIGELADFENSFQSEYTYIPKYSYKHSQEFKFIHYLISNEKEIGNQTFRNQLNNTQGWFDYIDGIRSDQANVGTVETRTDISPLNTLEFQWNNVLIKKSPKSFNYYEDERYLRDNFNYQKIGYLNISQGFEFKSNQEDNEFTRFNIKGGYIAKDWLVSFDEYYFHKNGDHIFRLNFLKSFDLLKVFSNLTLNTLDDPNLKTILYGFHLRPSDLFGFTINLEHDLENSKTLRSLYAIDYLPTNNCWKMAISYRKTIVDNRISFDWSLNFGDSDFNTPNSNVSRL